MTILMVVFVSLVCGLIIHRISVLIPYRLERQWLDESLDYLDLESQRVEYEKKLITSSGLSGLLDYWPFSRGAAPDDGKFTPGVIMLITLAIIVLFYYQFRHSLAFYVLLPFIVLTVSASIIDLRHQLLPDRLVYPLLWMGLLANTLSIFATPVQAILGVVVIYGSITMITIVLSRIRGRLALGGGDVKYMAALGAWVGFHGIFVLLMLAGIVFLSQGLMQKLFGTQESMYAFGPSLTVAALAVLWIGPGEAQRLFEQIVSIQ